MNIGVFFGSFNPIHLGHISIAKCFLEEKGIDEIWLSVSPQNPWKVGQGLATMKDRVAMCHLALAKNENIKVIDFEKNLPQPSYTYEALLELNRLHPKHTFILLIGGDNCHSFSQWRNAEKILEQFEVMAYPRKKSDMSAGLASRIKIVEAPLWDFASTNIREAIKEKTEVLGLDDSVLEYIQKHKIYE